jgi:hypothetical protein
MKNVRRLKPFPIALFFTTVVAATGTARATPEDDAAAQQTSSQLDALRQDIAEQGRRLETLQRQLTAERARYNLMRQAIENHGLMQYRARGTDGADGIAPGVAQAAPRGGAATPAPVGVAPPREASEAKVAQIFEQPGVLTPKGHYVVEPSLQYAYSSNNRVALVGYTIIPALLVGLVDERNTVTAALSGRYGVSNRFELEVKIPYVYRSDSTVSREIFTGSAIDRAFDTTGKALGDVELGARYQFNDGGADLPYFIGTLRLKTRTGRDPFSVVTDCATRCIGNTTGTGLPLDLPTGSGFNSLQPGLTWLFPSDPAVFFGSFSYTHSFARDNVSRTVLNGEQEALGKVQPGDILGTNFGLGLALNDKSSFSVGFDINSVGRTRQNAVVVPGAVRTVLASLLMGYSYRLGSKTTLSVAVGAGLTRDTPDVTLNLKLPIAF